MRQLDLAIDAGQEAEGKKQSAEKWVNLLANASAPNDGEINVIPAHVEILAGLSPEEARMLDWAFMTPARGREFVDAYGANNVFEKTW